MLISATFRPRGAHGNVSLSRIAAKSDAHIEVATRKASALAPDLIETPPVAQHERAGAEWYLGGLKLSEDGKMYAAAQLRRDDPAADLANISPRRLALGEIAAERDRLLQQLKQFIAAEKKDLTEMQARERDFHLRYPDAQKMGLRHTESKTSRTIYAWRSQKMAKLRRRILELDRLATTTADRRTLSRLLVNATIAWSIYAQPAVRKVTPLFQAMHAALPSPLDG